VFKNLIIYRLGPDTSTTLAQLEDALEKARFIPCGATQPQSVGWVPPRGNAHGPLVEAVGGHWLMRLSIEQRVLPGSVVKRRTDELAAQVEQATGRKPGRKQSKELKEQALMELLPMAFTKQSALQVWMAPAERLLMLDTSSAARADEAITLLVKSIEGLAVNHLHTEVSPAAAMAEWLASGEPPASFTVDRDCELKSADEMKSVVRYARHPLDIDEVREHIAQGKQPTRLALTWDSRVSFLLTDVMHLKKIDFQDVVFEGRGAGPTNADEEFDANAAIATGELIQLIPDLVDALGGEHVLSAP
jgi:recombination associated protein RdgC